MSVVIIDFVMTNPMKPFMINVMMIAELGVEIVRVLPTTYTIITFTVNMSFETEMGIFIVHSMITDFVIFFAVNTEMVAKVCAVVINASITYTVIF